MPKVNDRGQIIVLAVFGMIVLLVVASVVVDLGMYVFTQLDAQSNVSTACVVAANSAMSYGGMYQAFVDSLKSNGVNDPNVYSVNGVAGQNEGSGINLVRGFEIQGDGTIRTALKYIRPTTFLQIVGINNLTINARSRCLERVAGVVPIAVRKSELKEGLIPTNKTSCITAADQDVKKDIQDYCTPILGQDVETPLDTSCEPTPDVLTCKKSQNNFRGAIFPMIHCLGDTSVTPNINAEECPKVQVYDPLDPLNPPSNEQTVKDLIGPCMIGINCTSVDYLTPGVRVATVNGTTAPELCKSLNSIYDIGDKVVVIIYNNVLYDPDPINNGPDPNGLRWENVGVLGFAIYQITDFQPQDKSDNCNSVYAVPTTGMFNSLSDIQGLTSREVSWSYNLYILTPTS